MNVGDIVHLPSDSRSLMTVVAVDGEDIECAWFNEDKLLETSSFPIQALARCMRTLA